MAKPAPNRLGMYEDVKEILDKALFAGGGMYTLPSHGKAVHWRQRAYKFRKLFAETISIRSPYDRITLARVADGTTTVHIKITTIEGVFEAAPADTAALLPSTNLI